MSAPTDRPGDDSVAEGDDDEFAEFQRALFVRLESFMDEQNIGDGYLSDLLVDAAIHLRMSAYAMEIEKPSVAGLKLELDRMRADVEQNIREAKKDSEDYIAGIKDMQADDAQDRG